jgi:hypothetical protein
MSPRAGQPNELGGAGGSSLGSIAVGSFVHMCALYHSTLIEYMKLLQIELIGITADLVATVEQLQARVEALESN